MPFNAKSAQHCQSQARRAAATAAIPAPRSGLLELVEGRLDVPDDVLRARRGAARHRGRRRAGEEVACLDGRRDVATRQDFDGRLARRLTRRRRLAATRRRARARARRLARTRRLARRLARAREGANLDAARSSPWYFQLTK